MTGGRALKDLTPSVRAAFRREFPEEFARMAEAENYRDDSTQLPKPAKGLDSSPDAAVSTPEAIPRPPKYLNKASVNEAGERFDSLWERKVYEEHAGKYPAVMRQVSVPLREGKRMRLDELIIHEVLDETRFIGEFVDAKGGKITEGWATKAAWFRSLYGIGVRIVQRADFKKRKDKR